MKAKERDAYGQNNFWNLNEFKNMDIKLIA